jgi:DNA-binding transcriptional LysR family regulator
MHTQQTEVAHARSRERKYMLKFDLDLLLIFDEIYQTASLTQSAENLGIAQPTVSVALGKLRQHFDDPLFIRTSKGMQPTPVADSVIDDVRATTAALHKTLSRRVRFEPAEAEREFRICMTDISEIVLLPTLLNHLKKEAPGVRLNIMKISPDTPKQLENGGVDLAVGFMPHLEAGFYQHKLFEQNFVCIVAADHPRIKGTLSKRAFLHEGHVLIKSSGTGHSIVERTMEKEHIVRRALWISVGRAGKNKTVPPADQIAELFSQAALA